MNPLVSWPTAYFSLAAGGLGLSRNPVDYAPALLIISCALVFFFGYRYLRRRF